MDRRPGKTVALFFGLPYSGKTALIHRLQDVVPGDAVFIDALFRDLVPEHEVCLDKWLSTQQEFIGLVDAAVKATEGGVVYVELGIFQRAYRTELIRRLSNCGDTIIPVMLVCESRDELRRRQEARAHALEQRADKLKIAIGLDELYQRIYPVFEYPNADEKYIVIDTATDIETTVNQVVELIEFR